MSGLFAPQSRQPRRAPLSACLGIAIAVAPGVPALANPHALRLIPSYLTAGAPQLPVSAPPLSNDRMDVAPGVARKQHDRYGALNFRPKSTATAAAAAVTNCNDHGTGSLRGAIATAPSGSTIDLSGLPCSKITLKTGAIDVTQNDLTLSGAGAYLLAIDGGAGDGYLDRVFDHAGTGTLDLRYLTITDATYATYAGPGNDAKGGCIRSMGNVSLTFSVVSNCRIAQGGDNDALGGGLYVAGNLTMLGSILRDNVAFSPTLPYGRGGGAFVEGGVATEIATISGNTATTIGGGLYVRDENDSGTASSFIDKTTISGNSARSTGGLALLHFGIGNPVSTIRSSTVSSNHAGFIIGGVYSNMSVNVQNSTIAFNVAASATATYGNADVGLAMAFATADLQSTIVSNNYVYLSPTPRDTSAYSGSIIGNSNLVTHADTPMPADTLYADPLLYPLSGNGGFTMTHALQADSPAIDAGNNSAGLSTDQRVLPRVVGDAADIGAFERQGPNDSDVIFFDGFE